MAEPPEEARRLANLNGLLVPQSQSIGRLVRGADDARVDVFDFIERFSTASMGLDARYCQPD
jgi:hypothetical protein